MAPIKLPGSATLAIQMKNGHPTACGLPLLNAHNGHPTACALPLADETGSELVEFALLLLPLMAVVFVIMDIAWVCFAQESLQHAVQTGVRSAITSYLPSPLPAGVTGQDGYIKSIVQQNAMGFLPGTDGLNKITINYYSPSNFTRVLTGNGSNTGGNVIEISIQGASVSLLGPVLVDSGTSVALNAVSSDVMEGSPNGIPPAR